ncbi:MAG: hypothetical protein ACK558_11840 [Pseudomonadota bacterium]
MAACAIAAMAFGPDANWDLRNYHLYSAWAWLEGRETVDVAAAQAQTWFNPALWVPHFLLFRQLDGLVLAALLGALHGLAAWPLLQLARIALPDAPPRVLLALVAAGLLAASFIGQLGASYGDNLLAGLALLGLALALDGDATPTRGLAAGACFGAVAALKLSHAPIALGCCGVVAALPSPRRGQLLPAVLAGAALAFGALAGPWMVQLWQRWGNPVFPMFDTLFPGDWIAPASARDLRFVPGDLAGALLRPFAALVDWRATSDYGMRDGRPLLLCLALLAAAVRWRALAPALRALCVGAAVAWLAWLVLFGYHRYLVALDLLAPILLFAVAPPAWRRAAALAIALAVLTTNPPNHERAPRDWPVGQPIGAPPLPITPDTLLVLAGDEPTAHVLPFLPRFAGAVRIEANLYGPGRPATRLQGLIRSRIDAHVGPLVLLVQGDDPAAALPALAEHALRVDAAACAPLGDALLPDGDPPILLCPLAGTVP